jgi:hypothetical protein
MTEVYDKIKGHAVTHRDPDCGKIAAVRIRDAAENLLIAIGMGWDIEDNVKYLRAALAKFDAERDDELAKLSARNLRAEADRMRAEAGRIDPSGVEDEMEIITKIRNYEAPPRPDASAVLTESADYIPIGGAGNGA